MKMKQIIKKTIRKIGLEVLSRAYWEKLLQDNAQLRERVAFLEAERKRLSYFSSVDFPVHFHEEHGACFLKNEGEHAAKVLICSIPKCGTYFIAEILKGLGFGDTQVHLWQDFIHDYRGQEVEEKRSDVLPKQFQVPLNESLSLIMPGQYGLGHFAYSAENERLFQDFKVVHVHRNLRAACVSMMRFACELKPQSHWFLQGDWKNQTNKKDMFLEYMTAHGGKYFDWVEPVVQWINKPDILSLSYEALTSEGVVARGARIQELARFLNLNHSGKGIHQVAEIAAKTTTMTSSGKPSRWQDYWGSEVETVFQKLGFLELNQKLGYDKSLAADNSGPLSRAA